jgi:hypothetical protein
MVRFVRVLLTEWAEIGVHKAFAFCPHILDHSLGLIQRVTLLALAHPDVKPLQGATVKGAATAAHHLNQVHFLEHNRTVS